MGARDPSRKPSRKDEATVIELDRAFLQRLGDRVREARARRGMTRKILARDSGVSERYLAQLESGRGNVSVLLLRQIAQALNLPVNDLVREENGQSVELTLIEQFLKRLPAAKLPEVRERLMREFGAKYGNRRGSDRARSDCAAPASPRSARELARRLGVPFVELDREIEAEAGTSLHEIFLLHGQAGFRRYERRASSACSRTTSAA